MNKIRNVSLSFLSVALIFLATSLSLKADKCDDCATEYDACLKRCLPLGCTQGCPIEQGICESKNCPVEYTLSNWSTFGLNFFNAKKKNIGSLGSPAGPLVVQESDFPITAAWAKACPTLDSDKRCTTDDKYRVVIEKGCHVVWYAVHFYTTGLSCGNKTPKGRAQRSAAPASKGKEIKAQGAKKTVGSSQEKAKSPGQKQ